jgi:competence protein ComEC
MTAFALAAAAFAACEASPRLVVFGSAPLIVVAVLLVRRRHRRARLVAEMLLACGIGAYVGARAATPPVLPGPLVAVLDSERRASIRGWITDGPEQSAGGARLRVAIEGIDGHAVQVDGALSIVNGVPALLPGDLVRFDAHAHAVRGLANPGVADSSLLARANGIDCFLGVGHAADILRVDDDARVLPRRPWLWPFRWAAQARHALDGAIDRATAGTSCALLHTAVLGERRNSDARVEDGFRAAGATHVLSVSGLHLAAVAFVFFVGLRRALTVVPRLPLWFDPRRLAALLALPAIAFYTLISGDAVATIRSALMMAVGLLGVVLGRRTRPVVAVAAASGALMAWSPLVLFDVSFQLSVVSVLALALLSGPLAPGFEGLPSLPGRVLRGVGRLGAATLAAGLTTAPLVAHHFGEVTPAAPLGNLLLVPLVEMVVVPFGLGGATLAALAGDRWGGPLLAVANGGARLALAAAEKFRLLAPVWTTRSPNAFETATLVVGGALSLAALPRQAGGRRVKALAAATLLGMGGVSLVVRDVSRRHDPDLLVTFLDVGQGDAAVIQAPGGGTILIDGGGTYDGSFDPGARVVEPFLRARGITRVDTVVLSHPHPDHLGGLQRILARFPVGQLWTSGDDGHNPEYHRLIDAARARGVLLPVPMKEALGPTVLEPLGPFVGDGGGERIGPPEGSTVNDASLVIRLAFGSRSVLFAGDIEADGEGEVTGRTAAGQIVASDVLKVPHHGSRTSSSAELLDVVRARLAVMSLGWKNRFHFPNADVVARYRARGVTLLRTDLAGAVTIRVTPDGDMTTSCARGCQ